MDQKCDSFYPSASFENNHFEQRLETKVNDVNSFKYHINNITETFKGFGDKNQKTKKKYKNYKTLNTILESVDTVVIIGASSTSITLSITGIGLTVFTISAGKTCVQSLGNKVLHKVIMNKSN